MDSFAALQAGNHAATASSGDDASLFVPQGVCAKLIRYVVTDGAVAHVSFSGGCAGNLQALSVLVEGMDVNDVIAKLEGIRCGAKPTSCADQFCQALRGYMGEAPK
jgi:uncharacterized protein (TIGR03905 family)